MHSCMQILRHLMGVALCLTLFIAGNLMVLSGRKRAGALTRRATTSGRLSKFFLCSGKIFEVVAVIAGFVETVAVMVLASGWLIDFVIGSGAAE